MRINGVLVGPSSQFEFEHNLGEHLYTVRQLRVTMGPNKMQKYLNDSWTIVDVTAFREDDKKNLCFIIGVSLPWKHMLSTSDPEAKVFF